MLREVVGAEQALLLAGHGDEQHRPPQARASAAQRGGGLDEGGDSRGIVHRAVEDAVPRHWLAHTQVIEVRRQCDELRAERRIGPRQEAHDVLRDSLRLVDRDRRPEPDGELESGKRFAAVGECLKRGIPPRRAGEQPIRAGGIEHHGHREPAGMSGRVRGKPHLRVQPGGRVALPGKIGARGGDGEHSDRSALLERVGTRRPPGGERRPGNPLRRRARQDHGHLATQVESLEVVMALLRQAHAVADEDQGSVHRSRAGAPQIDGRVSAELQRLRLSGPNERETRARLRYAAHVEAHGLEPARGPRGDKARLPECRRHVVRRLAVLGAPRLPAAHRVVREGGDVSPPRLGLGLSYGGGPHEEESGGDQASHRLSPGRFCEDFGHRRAIVRHKRAGSSRSAHLLCRRKSPHLCRQGGAILPCAA
jgi:hypothetical protein